jgi:spore maturation protein CgeB
MKIALIFNREREDTTGLYFARALDELGYRFDHFWTKEAMEIAPGYDLYLRIDHGDYKYDIPDHLHPAAFYAIDTHLKASYAKIKKQLRHYDFIFCAQQDAAGRLKSKGINAFWLPLACDTDLHCKLDLEKCYDLGFVGNDGGIPRKFFLQQLRERCPNSFIARASFRDMGNIYSRSKIGFNYSINNDINMRIFEIMASGAMLLTNAIQDNGFDRLFADKQNVVVYKNPKDLFELIDYYLANQEQRQKIADRGAQLVRANHRYRDRINKILEYTCAAIS